PGDEFTQLALRVGELVDAHFAPPAPPPVLGGDDLATYLALAPGPELGRLLHAVREAQLAGRIATRDDALALAQELRDAASSGAPSGEGDDAPSRDVATFLDRVPLFHGLPVEDRRRITAIAELRRCAAGERIFDQGDGGDRMYIVVFGKVRIFRPGDGDHGPVELT